MNKKFKVAIIIFMVVLIAGIGWLQLYRYTIKQKISDNISALESKVSEVSQTLSYSGEQSVVYDNNNEVLFSMNLGGASGVKLSQSQAEIFRDKVVDPYSLLARGLDLNDDIVLKNVSDDYITSLLLKTINYNDMLYSYLEDNISEIDALSYVASIGEFGELGSGMAVASYSLYSKEYSELTKEQFKLLCTSFSSNGGFEDVIDSFSTTVSIDKEELLNELKVTYNGASFYNGLRDFILEELKRVLSSSAEEPVKLSEFGKLRIKTSINSKLQKELQLYLDNAMRDEIDLSTTGKYAMDASIVCADASSNYIIAYIPSRVQPDNQYTTVDIDYTGMVKDFEYVRNQIASGKTSKSLISVKDANGVSNYIGLDKIFRAHNIPGSDGAEAVTGDILDVLDLGTGGEASVLLEVMDSDGNSIYTATGSKSVDLLNDLLLQELMFDGSLSSYVYEKPNGSIHFAMGKSFSIAMYAGSNAVGYNEKIAEDKVTEIMSNICNSCQKYYKVSNDLSTNDFSQTVGRTTVSLDENYNILKQDLNSRLQSLNNLRITTSKDRSTFEDYYDQLTVYLSDMSTYLPASVNQQLKAEQERIRRNKSEQLLSVTT